MCIGNGELISNTCLLHLQGYGTIVMELFLDSTTLMNVNCSKLAKCGPERPSNLHISMVKMMYPIQQHATMENTITTMLVDFYMSVSVVEINKSMNGLISMESDA